MIAHVSLHVSDFKKSKDFYAKVLQHVGYTPHFAFEDACGFIEGGHTSFWIVKEDEKIVPTHIAFETKDEASVQAFYETARAEGAKDNGAPGYRPECGPEYYAAFVYDPDGHNIEAVWYDYSESKPSQSP